MKATLKSSIIAGAVATALAAPAVQATNGYFLIGYGAKTRGMAGAGIAYGQDGLAAATNPAAMGMLSTNRIDAGIELFSPLRDGSLDASGVDVGPATGGALSGAGVLADYDSGATAFAVPNLGAAMRMGDMTVGLTMTGAGGMNTRYNTNIYNSAFGPAIGQTSTLGLLPGGASGFAGLLETGFGIPAATINPVLFNGSGTGLYEDSTAGAGATLGVNLAQMIIAPSISKEISEGQTVGASLLIGYQRFRAYGLGLFKGLSSDASAVTNVGDDDAWGAGVKIGWTGEIGDNLTLGVVATSKIYMQEFDKYKGLFAEQGDFDIPASFGIGLSYQMSPKTAVAVDVTRILYSGVASINNPGPTADEFFNALTAVLTQGAAGTVSNPLGSDNGWGFGWDDITVVKIGVDHQYDKHWTFRGGLNVGGNPIDNDQNLFNIIAPGIVQTHVTLGATYAFDDYSEVTMTYMRALREDQSYTYQGTGSNAAFSYDTAIGMDQHALEISYGMKF